MRKLHTIASIQLCLWLRASLFHALHQLVCQRFTFNPEKAELSDCLDHQILL